MGAGRAPEAHGRAREWWPYLVVVAAPLLLFMPFLFGLQSLYWGTPLLQFYPWREYGFELMRAGQWPLWNPYVGNGAPLLANYQSALLYPPNWLGFLLPVDAASAWLVAAHLAWAGAGTVTLARGLGLRPLGQVVAGLAFGMSQFLVSRSGFFSMNATAAWLPWLVAAADGAARAGLTGAARRALRGGLALAVGVGLMLLAGHAQFAWYALLFTGAWCGWRLLVTAVPLRRRLLTGGWLLVAVLWGVTLAAIQLLPTAELMQQSPRAEAADYAFVVNYSFSPWRLVTLLVPDFLGNPARGTFYGYGNYWEDAVYIGVLPALLAAGAAVGALAATIRSRRHDPNRRVTVQAAAPASPALLLVVVAAAALVLALGQNTPVFPFFYAYVPTFDLFQGPARLNLLFVFALAMLAGLGADAWQPPTGRALYWTRLGAMGAATLFGSGVVAVLAVTPDTDTGRQVETLARGLTLGGGWLLAALLLSLLQPKVPVARRAGLVGVFVALDLLAANYGLNPGAASDAVRRAPATAAPLAAALGDHRLMYYPDDEQVLKFGRLLSFEQFGPPDLAAATRAAMLPNSAMLDRLATANNFEPLVSTRYVQFMSVISETRSVDLLELMDVAVVASPDTIAGWERVAEAPEAGVGFYRVPAEPRRWWLVSEARVMPDTAGLLAALADPGFDPAREVLLEANGALQAGNAPALTLALDTVTMPVALAQPGWLVFADTYYPGWHAWLDGQPVPMLAANAAFRAVAVPAGEHVVAFAYQPRSFALGWKLTLAAGLVWLIASGWIVTRRELARPSPVRAAMSTTDSPSADQAMSIVVVLPTYNEFDNLRQLAPELLALRDDLSLIVVDDNSPDGTGKLADELSGAFPNRLTVIHRAGKQGLGTAYVAGFKRALAGPAGAILTMDADYSHHPRHIASMVTSLASADLVIGSRYVPGGEVVDSPSVRRLLSKTANMIAHLGLGLHARDVTAGFRLYRRDVLAALPLDYIFSSGYSFLIEMLYMVERRGWRVAEVPIQFKDRTMGQSKISRAEVGRALYTVARLAFRRLRGR